MRFVVYDDESLEPITVLSLPLTERDALARRYWRVPVPQEISVSFAPIGEEQNLQRMQVVDLWFEPFVRGRQRSVMCFTKATGLAMLLNPAWLPGQRGAVQYLQDQNDMLTRMLMGAFID